MNKKLITLIIILGIITMIQSCDDDNNNEKNISKYFETESHNSGKNCMDCHKSGGEGEGWFNAAGTVYDSQKTSVMPNGTIKLYTEAEGKGDLIAVIEVDGKGNFFTTEDIDFSKGLYPVAISEKSTEYMSSSVKTGQCNSCHGVSTSHIWTE